MQKPLCIKNRNEAHMAGEDGGGGSIGRRSGQSCKGLVRLYGIGFYSEPHGKLPVDPEQSDRATVLKAGR